MVATFFHDNKLIFSIFQNSYGTQGNIVVEMFSVTKIYAEVISRSVRFVYEQIEVIFYQKNAVLWEH